MRIQLEHNFINRCHDINKLLEDTYKLATFTRKLEQQSSLYPDRYDPDKYKGDGLELFAEALIKLSPIDNRIGIGDYHPVEESEDTGVDGYGIGIDGNVATVQVKFRGRNDSYLTANEDHLSNFTTSSIFKYKVKSDTTTNLLVITTAKGLHHFTDNEMFLNQVRCLGYNELREMVDNNNLFWNKFRSLIKENK